MENRFPIRHYKNVLNLPSAFTVTALAICIIPAIIVLSQLNVNTAIDFKYAGHSHTDDNLTNFLLYHCWLAFGIASCFIAGGLALADYALRKEAAGLIAGVALSLTGLYDAVYLLLDYNILSGQDFSGHIYSRWLISRFLYAALFAISAVYFILSNNRSIQERSKAGTLLILACLLLTSAAIALPAFPEIIPDLYNKNQFITRPYELFTLLIYLVLGFFILPHILLKFPSRFSGIIILSVMPTALASVFMAICRENFDIFFNTACFLRSAGYLIPLAGVVLNYNMAIKKEKYFIEQLRDQALAGIQIQKNLEEREASLLKAGTELERKVEELKRSNSELEQFAYVASHDIQEPLRKIKAFSALIERDYANMLPAQVQNYLGRMRKASERLQLLIDDLLSLSRVSNSKNAVVRVRLKDIIDDVLADLEYIIEKKNARIGVKVNIQLNAIPVQMRQLFQNLISNSLKFSRPGIPPSITIEANCIKGEDWKNSAAPGIAGTVYYRIEITDNGIGFDQQDAEKIFNLFHRLHGRREYEGTGLGLALCKKIAENHFGYIEAEGKEGIGAKIRVYLPC